MRVLMQDFDMQAERLQIVATREEALRWAGSRPAVIDHRDPPVPFTTNVAREYRPCLGSGVVGSDRKLV
jgi:hypothetical protein